MPTISASRLPGDEFIATLYQGESLLTMEQQKLTADTAHSWYDKIEDAPSFVRTLNVRDGKEPYDYLT